MNVESLNQQGLEFKRRGDLVRAEQVLRQAVVSAADYLPALGNLAVVLRLSGRPNEALPLLQSLVEKAPAVADAHYSLANVLSDLGRHGDAIASYRQALLLAPDFAEAWVNLGIVHFKLKQHREALACYRSSAALRPEMFEVQHNLAVCADNVDAVDEGLAAVERALSIQPTHARARCTYSSLLRKSGRFQECLRASALALKQAPDNPDLHWNYCLEALRNGDYANGWREYEWRWQRSDRDESLRDYPQPLWRGQIPLAGKKLLIWAEQGLGDSIQFCRYLHLLSERGAKVFFEVQAPLHRLMHSLPEAITLLRRGEALPAFDLHCPLLSLPHYLDPDGTNITGTPYLDVPESEVARFQLTMFGTRTRARPQVGLVWRGSPTHKRDADRSLAFSLFSRIVESHPEIDFHCLQVSLNADERLAINRFSNVQALSDHLHDFFQTACAVRSLDLTITVDTSVAHLCGALGTPAWVLLPLAPDWRWLLGRSDSPWYNRLRLFRQRVAGDWRGVLDEVDQQLSSFQLLDRSP